MEIDSPYPKFAKNKRLKLSPIPKRLVFQDDDEDDAETFKEKFAAAQRRLSFDNDSMVYEENPTSEAEDKKTIDEDEMKIDEDSPPFERIKSLKVFGSSTPFAGRTTPPSKDTSLLSVITATPRIDTRSSRIKTSPMQSTINTSRLFNAAPVNPFTPNGRLIVSENQKRKQNQRKALHEWLSCSSGEDSIQNTSKSSDCDLNEKSIVGASFSELETTRFAEEFKVDSFIASGSFGHVYKCTNYVDGMEYAIKKSVFAVAGTSLERVARKEVFAHAALKSHPHIVNYHSSWIEDGHLFIQLEYCNGGSLETVINEEKKIFTECGLRRLSCHVAKGLKYIHSLRLAHMDLKPANIFVCKISTVLSSDEELDEVDCDDVDIVYKIGDLGHVSNVDEPYDVEDGDCRYMPKELLNENYCHLQKADVFSFGMTLYEAAGGGPLPKNGNEWQELRSGNPPYLNKYSSTFNQFVKSLLHPDPEKRPNVKSILQQTRISSDALRQQIFSIKVKGDFYARQVKAAQRSFLDNHTAVMHKDNIPKILVEHA